MKFLYPRPSHQYNDNKFGVKISILGIMAQSKEDIAKMRETLAADLQKVDRSKVDAALYDHVKAGPPTFANEEEGLQIAKEIRESIDAKLKE